MTGIIIAAAILYLIANRKKYSTIIPPDNTYPVWPPPSGNGTGNTGTPPENWGGDNSLPPVYVPPTETGSAPDKNLLGQMNLPRGMRNNNPGNLRIGASAWTGKIPPSQNTDGSFEQFYLYKWGVRAMIKLIRNYINTGTNTTRKIITKYAPSNENHTASYINTVMQTTGINPDAVLNANDYELLQSLIIAMAFVENGVPDAITTQDFITAWSLL